MKVVVISGAAGAGKDTLANIMKEQLEGQGCNVLITHYADLLKHICTSFFGWNGEKDEVGRSLLQYVGTDLIRKKNPDYWVNFICDMLDLFDGEWDVAIIPDCRFPNELDRLKEAGHQVTHIQVERQGYVSRLNGAQKAHASETSMDGVIPDYVIHNDGNLEELKASIEVSIQK